MIQDISTKYGHKDNLTRELSPCEVPTSSDFVANEVAARCQRSGGSSPAKWRLVVSLFLMLFVGVCGVKAQGSFELTTEDDVANGTEKLYWIESKGATGFFAISHSDNTNISTSNMPNERMLWYFMDASVDNTQYYYVVNKSTGKYMKLTGNLGANTSIQLASFSASDTEQNKDKFRFSISEDSEAWVLFPKSAGTSYWVNKQSGNVPYGNKDKGWFKASNWENAIDDNSRWYFVAKPDVTWAHPFTDSNSNEKYYYLIQSANTNTFYMSTDNGYASVSTDENNNRVWYFEEAESDATIPHLKYYYIINAQTGNYMYYNGATNGSATSTNAVLIQAHSGGTEDNYKFAVLNAIGNAYSAFAIMPKKLIGLYDYKFNSLGAGTLPDKAQIYTLTNNNHIATIRDRGVNTNSAHWKFVSTTFTGAWTAPEVACDETGTITITGEDGAAFYYTTDGNTIPTENPSLLYSESSKPTVSAGKTTIKVRAIADGKNPSNVVTKTIIYNPTISLTANSYTYTGNAQNPVSSVDYVDSENSANNIHFDVATDYTVSYKKGGAAVAECKNADTYAIVLNDVDGDEYIVCGAQNFTITKTPLTVTANAHTMAYGDTPTNNGVTFGEDDGNGGTINGFVNSETESVLGGSLGFDYSYTQYGNVGDYTIIPKGLTSDNYEISFVAGPLTVSPATATVTADAKGKVYGAAEPTLTATVTGKKREADEIIYTVSREEGENAGDYTIIPSGEAEQGNYTVNYVAGTFTISQKALTVTAKANEITYGDAPANDGVTYSGFIEGESENTGGMFTGTLSYVYSYSQYDDVGNTYTITPSGLTATNYAITFVAGTLTVNQRETDIEWGNTSLGYNGSPQTPTATATNVVNNDEVTVTVTGAQTNVGTDYTATATGFTGTKAGNYVLVSSNITTTFSIGTGTFTPTVSIDGWTFGEASNAPSVSGNMSGGDVTYTYSVKGENNYSSTVPTNAGDYTVKVAIAASGNYDSAEATKDFTISPKSIGDGKDLATDIDIKIEQDGDDVKVTYVKDGETTLVVDNDYSVSIDVQGEDKYVIVTGIGNYTGSAQGLFVMSVFTKPTGATEAASVYQASSDLAKPNDITPYIVRKVNPSIGTMVITPIDYIPKDVPVLMLRTGQATGFLASPKEDAIAEITAQTKNSNLLKVAPEDGIGVEAAQVYMFYLGEFVLTKKGTITNGKFFLYNPNYTATPPAEEGGQQGGSGNAPSLSALRFVIEEEPTGIVEMRKEKGEMRNGSDWFTLDGRKLNEKPTKPGLYIRNGRKTIIKRK